MPETTPTTSDAKMLIITITSSRVDYAFTRVSSIGEIITGRFQLFKLIQEKNPSVAVGGLFLILEE